MIASEVRVLGDESEDNLAMCLGEGGGSEAPLWSTSLQPNSFKSVPSSQFHLHQFRVL